MNHEMNFEWLAGVSVETEAEEEVGAEVAAVLGVGPLKKLSSIVKRTPTAATLILHQDRNFKNR